MKHSAARNKLLRDYCNRYEKSPNGYLMRKYRNMLSRIRGVQKKKAHLYKGKTILPKHEFYDWALTHPDFKSLFAAYKRSNRKRKYAPTVNRIDSKRGYELGNMEWLTHSENSSLGSTSELRMAQHKLRKRRKKPIAK